jgi:hypothetical protein
MSGLFTGRAEDGHHPQESLVGDAHPTRLPNVPIALVTAVTLAETVKDGAVVGVGVSRCGDGLVVTRWLEIAGPDLRNGLVLPRSRAVPARSTADAQSCLSVLDGPLATNDQNSVWLQGRGLMSETSTSHTQWIQHAVAAAKAGNPSVAKIQLQKAAEEAPGDPTVWLWMGWLADSPASAAQCLELARVDERFEKIAVAGIEFAKALAEFQLDQFAESVETNDDAAETDDDEQDGMTLDPVEAVEEVFAAVEFLQQEDTTELTADQVEESTELVADESIKPESRPDAVCDEALTEPLAVNDLQAVSSESISDESNEDDPDVAETVAEQPSESSTGNNVEAELMESANEIGQINDEMTVEAPPASEEATRETNTD